MGSVIHSEKDILKYEYIEMVTRGYENEHLEYILSDAKEGRSWNKETLNIMRK